MRLILLLAVLMIFISNLVFSQEFLTGIETGIGKYSMSGLRDINSSITDQLPFDSEVVSDFPPYLYYEPQLLVRFGHLTAGIIYSFQSTGSRISSKDYSGEYRFDMKVRSSAPGLYCEYEAICINDFRLSVYTSLKGVFSRLHVYELLMIDDNRLRDESQEFKSFSCLVEPGLNLSRSFGIIEVGIVAGYAINLGGYPYHSTDNEDNILTNPVSGEKVRPDWSGFRAGLYLSISLNKKSS